MFAKVYDHEERNPRPKTRPHGVRRHLPFVPQKIERKGRTQDELDRVIEWLTGFKKPDIDEQIGSRTTFERFFEQADLNPKAKQITGSICGHKIQGIENPLTKRIRYLDKLVDELAKGKKMDTILRS